MTPFELTLQSELDVERQRFGNKWLFPWHSINIPNRTVDVEDFRGGRITVGGIVFHGQIQEIYWQAIGRYLVSKVHESFRKWSEETKAYPVRMQQSSVEGTALILRRFVAAVMEEAAETDRRLRGRGHPEKVPAYNSTGQHSQANAEILRLTDAHKALIEERPSFVRRIEAFGTKYRSTIAIVALLVAVAFGLLRVFAG